MSVKEIYSNSILRQRWDDDARLYIEWDAAGQQILQRAYTAAENARADADAASALLVANEATIDAGLAADLAVMQAIIDQTNAALRDDPSQEIKDLARVARRLIRKVEQLLDGVD